MPWCKVLSFTEPFSYQSAFRSVEVELFPTAKGKFCAELTQVCMNTLWVHGAHEDLPRVYIAWSSRVEQRSAFLPGQTSPRCNTVAWTFCPAPSHICHVYLRANCGHMKAEFWPVVPNSHSLLPSES